MTNWTNVNNVAGILKVANDNTGNLFWFAMVFMVSTVIGIALIPYGLEASLLTASFIGLIASIILVYADLVAWEYCLIFVGLIVLCFIWIIYNSRSEKYT